MRSRTMELQNGVRSRTMELQEKEEKRGRNIFTRVWIKKIEKARVGGEKKEMEKK